MLQRITKSGSFWAIVDQAIASAGNFLTTLLLARSLVPAEFGTYALLYSACVVMFGFQGNLVVSPLVVLGATSNPARMRTYLTAALLLTFVLVPASAVVVLPAAASLHRLLTGMLALLFVASWQLQETTRRALMAGLRYADAVWGDALSYLGQALLVGLLVFRRHLILDQAFMLMAGTSLLAVALQSWQVRLNRTTWIELRDCAKQFWSLGKWLAVVSLLTIGQGPLFPWLLNWFHGRAAAATFQAVMNVWGLTNPIVNSIPAIVIPATAALVLKRGSHSGKSLLELGMKYVLQLELLLAPLFIAVAIWPHRALSLFYGKASVYSTQTTALRVGVIVFLLTVPMTVFGAVLTGAGRTRNNATMNGVGTLASLVSAPPLIYAGGAVGAMCAEIVTRSVRVLWALRLLNRPSGASPEGGLEVDDRTIYTEEV